MVVDDGDDSGDDVVDGDDGDAYIQKAKILADSAFQLKKIAEQMHKSQRQIFVCVNH